LGIREDFAQAWTTFFTQFNEGITRTESEPEKKAQVITIANETLNALKELQNNLKAYQGNWLSGHTVYRTHYRTMTEWINYVGNLIEQLGAQITRAEGIETEEETWKNKWLYALRGHRGILSRNIGSFDVNTIRDLSSGRNWQNLCNSLNTLNEERERAVGLCDTMIQALQTTTEFRNLMRDTLTAAGSANDLKNSLNQIDEILRTVRANSEGAAEYLRRGMDEGDRVQVEDESRDKIIVWRNIQEYLDKYNEFTEYKRSDEGNIELLIHNTIRVLNIQI